MRKAWFVAFTVAACAALPAAAQEEEPAAEAKKEKLICKYELLTGSRTRSTRTCLTQAQWREVGNQTKKGLDDFNRQSAVRGGTGTSAGYGN